MKKNSICEYVATNSSVRVMNEQNKKRIKKMHDSYSKTNIQACKMTMKYNK